MLLGADANDQLVCGEQGWDPVLNPGPSCVELKCNRAPPITGGAVRPFKGSRFIMAHL